MCDLTCDFLVIYVGNGFHLCDPACDLLVIRVGHVFLLCDPTCDLLVIHVGTQTIFVFEEKKYVIHQT